MVSYTPRMTLTLLFKTDYIRSYHSIMSGFLMRLGSPYYLARVALLGVYVAVRILCNDAFSEAIDET